MDHSTNMPSQAPEKPSSKKLSTGKKVLIGFGIGCGTLIIIIVIAIGYAAWWAFSPEDQVATNRILHRDSAAVFRVEDVSRNQGAMELLSSVFREAQRRSEESAAAQMPPFLKKLQNYSGAQQDPGRFFSYVSPKEMTVSVSLDEAGNPQWVIAANFRLGTRIVKKILKSTFNDKDAMKENRIATRYGDLYIFNGRTSSAGNAGEQTVVGFFKGTLLISNETESATSALRHLSEGNDAGELNAAFSESFSRLSQAGCLAYGVLDGHFLGKADLEIGPYQGALYAEMKKVELSLDIPSSNEGILNVHIEWNNKKLAIPAAKKFEDLKTQWITTAAQDGFDLNITNSLHDSRQDIRFRVDNLKSALAFQIRKVERE